MPPTKHTPPTQTPKSEALRLHVMILMAGASKRFHGIKALANVGGQTMLERTCQLARSLDNTPVTAVVGAHLEDLLPPLTTLRLPFVVNTRWHEGQSTSVRAAARSLPTDVDGMLILTVDQVALTPVDLRKLVDAFCKKPDHIVCAAYAGTRGVPAIFPSNRLQHLGGDAVDRGAQELLLNDAAVIAIDIADAQLDIDTHEQLTQFNHAHASRNARN